MKGERREEEKHITDYYFLSSGDMSSRRTRPEICVRCVQFSPTGTYDSLVP